MRVISHASWHHSVSGGTVHKLVYDVAYDAYIDIELEFNARLASD